MRSLSFCVAGLVVVCAWASAGYAQVIGDWEGVMDGWVISANAPPGTTTAFSTTGVTRGASALQLTVPVGGYQEALSIELNTVPLQNAFFDNNQFAISLTRLAAEWPAVDTVNGTWNNGIQLLVDAGSNEAGFTWQVYQILPYHGGWNSVTQGNQTVGLQWEYGTYKAAMNRAHLQWLRLTLVTNYTAADYTATGSHYLDDAHFFPGLPLLADWEQRRDTWYLYDNPGQVNLDYSNLHGATLHSYSLKVTPALTGTPPSNSEWKNGPVIDMNASPDRVDAFLANKIFSVDATRLASDFVPDPAITSRWSNLHMVINAGWNAGTGYAAGSVWHVFNGAGAWAPASGDSTMTVSFDYFDEIHNWGGLPPRYERIMDIIANHRPTMSWFQIMIAVNNHGYTGELNWYLDNVRLGLPPPSPQNFFTINTFDTAAEVTGDIPNGITPWTGPGLDPGVAPHEPPTTIEWDPTVDADNNPASGSMKVTVVWDPTDVRVTEYQVIMSRDMFPNLIAGANLSEYVLFKAKVKVDSATSPQDPWTTYGWSNWVFRDISWSWDQWTAGGNLGGNPDINGWTIYSAVMTGDPAPVPARTYFRALTYQLGGTANGTNYLTGTTTFWVDNIQIGRMQPCSNPMHCELCDDQVDDNGNGLVDCADPDCLAVTGYCQTVCNDGLDFKGNGLIDCADPACTNDPNCVHNIPFADLDGDGDVDADDFALWQLCYTGPGMKPAPQGCGFLDRNNDGSVDQLDFADFQKCQTGPGVAPNITSNPDCNFN